MIKRTFNLNDLFTLDTGFYGWCLDTIGEIIPNVLTTTSLQDNFRNYMLKPLWRKYQYVNANYDDSDSGRQQFRNDFANQLQDICVEFYTYVKANVKHFEGLDNKTDLIKQVSSVVAPINDIIEQTATDTALAKGTTAQNIGTTLYNDSVWLSMFNTYMTPQRKGEMLNRFAWLFLIAYYTGEKEQEEEYVLEVADKLNMRNGDQVIEFEVDEEITEVVVTIEKPTSMIPRNIVNGVNIGGVVGTHECEVVEPVIEELVITENGTYNAPSGVDGYNPVNVNVEGLVPTGTIELTENGEYDVTTYANAKVNVNTFPTYIATKQYPNDFTKLFYSSTINDTQLNTLMNGLDTSNVTSMSNMFYSCESLTSIPQLDTSSVTNMEYMFRGCKSLTSIPQLDTSNVTTMSNMFYSCKSLTSIPLFDTSNVTNMLSMFGFCTNLTTIPQLDTSSVTNMTDMFDRCYNLTSIPLLNTSNVTDMKYMFWACSNLTTIPQLDTSSVTNMMWMFIECTNLTTIPQLDTSNVTNMEGMFIDCTNLTTIPQLDISNVTNMEHMFKGCSNLTSVTFINMENTTADYSYIFASCPNLKSLIMSGAKKSFDISYSTQFETQDLVNLIDSLYDFIASGVSTYAMGGGAILTMGSTNLAKLTSKQKEVAYAKGWELI